MSVSINKKARRATDKLNRRKEDSEGSASIQEVKDEIIQLKKALKGVVKKKRHWSKKSSLWLINIKSSMIKKAGYDLKNKELYVMFKTKEKSSGKYNEYKYLNVPIEWWAAFTLAESKGKHFSNAKYDLENMEKLV